MIDFTLLWIWSSIAGITFLLVYIGLRFSSWKEKPTETTDETTEEIAEESLPKTKSKRTFGQWVITVFLVVSGILAFLLFSLPLFFFIALYYAVPHAVFILFVICLIRYIRIRSKQKRCPEEVSPEEVKFHKTCMIVFAVLFIVALAVLLCLLFIPSGDIAYM